MFTAELFTRAKGSDNWGGGTRWNKIYGQNNTTVDSNGFIKVASPIFRIGRKEDAITNKGFAPAGYGATNEEANGCYCERIDEGVYRIHGSKGFSTDGAWTIETPKDENGQPLLWVDSNQDEDGVITINTYHRTHPAAPSFARNIIEGKVEGDHIDIPNNRWIDIRLSMPEDSEYNKKAVKTGKAQESTD